MKKQQQSNISNCHTERSALAKHAFEIEHKRNWS